MSLEQTVDLTELTFRNPAQTEDWRVHLGLILNSGETLTVNGMLHMPLGYEKAIAIMNRDIQETMGEMDPFYRVEGTFGSSTKISENLVVAALDPGLRKTLFRRRVVADMAYYQDKARLNNPSSGHYVRVPIVMDAASFAECLNHGIGEIRLLSPLDNKITSPSGREYKLLFYHFQLERSPPRSAPIGR